MKTYKLIFWFIWVLAFVWAALHEADVLPGRYIEPGAELNYVLNLVCIVLSIGGAWLACRLFVFRYVEGDLHAHPERLGHWTAVRLGITAVTILPAAFLYYAAENSSSVLCCALIGLTASIFCRPAPLAVDSETTDDDAQTDNI